MSWCAVVGGRALPSIPLTTTTTSQRQQRQQQQQETTFQTTSSTTFDDDGHYTDIHVTMRCGGGAARIPTWRRSFVDDLDHYNYLEFNQLTTGVEQRGQRASVDAPDQLPPVYNYASIGSDEPQSRVDPQGYLEPVEQSLEQQAPRQLEENTLKSEENDVNPPGSEVLEPELRAPQRPGFYAGIDNNSAPTERCAVHSYLELTDGYSAPGNMGAIGTADGGTYQGLDPTEVEEMRRRAAVPQEYAGLNADHSGSDDGEVTDRGAYEGLDPAEVEEFRRRAREPREYAALTDLS